jgi:hypothetical protein
VLAVFVSVFLQPSWLRLFFRWWSAERPPSRSTDGLGFGSSRSADGLDTSEFDESSEIKALNMQGANRVPCSPIDGCATLFLIIRSLIESGVVKLAGPRRDPPIVLPVPMHRDAF